MRALVRFIDRSTVAEFRQEGASADALLVVDDRLEGSLPEDVVADGFFQRRVGIFLLVVAQDPTIVVVAEVVDEEK